MAQAPARIAHFRATVEAGADPAAEETLRISYDGGQNWIPILLYPQEKSKLIAALQGSVKPAPRRRY